METDPKVREIIEDLIRYMLETKDYTEPEYQYVIELLVNKINEQ